MKFECPKCGEKFLPGDIEIRGNFVMPFWGSLSNPVQETYPVVCEVELACPECNEVLIEEGIDFGTLSQCITVDEKVIDDLLQKVIDRIGNK